MRKRLLSSSSLILMVLLAGCNDAPAPSPGVATQISTGSIEPMSAPEMGQQADAILDAPTGGARIASFARVAGVAPGGQENSSTERDGSAATARDGVKLAYSHQMSISLPPDSLRRRFTSLRDACANDAALRCTLLDASLFSGSGGQLPHAWIHARLPHDTIQAFKEKAVTLVAGEARDAARILQDSTRVEDVSKSVIDVERRIALLEAYRARLEQIAARKDSRVEDLIRVANEISQVQSQIESMTSTRTGLNERVDTEAVSVSYQSETPPGGPSSPLRDVWRRASSILSSSAAGALAFALGALPWLVVIFVVAILAVAAFAGVVRLARGRAKM